MEATIKAAGRHEQCRASRLGVTMVTFTALPGATPGAHDRPQSAKTFHLETAVDH